MIVGEVGVNTINGDTLVKMQTLEPPKTALQIAIDKLCDTISRYGTIAAVVTFIALMLTDIAHIGLLQNRMSRQWNDLIFLLKIQTRFQNLHT